MADSRLIGKVLNGRYKINASVRERCGMEAYRAYDRESRRSAVIFPEIGTTQNAVPHKIIRDRAFELSMLSHPELIKIINFYEDNTHGRGFKYVVTEYFEAKAFSVMRKEFNINRPQAAHCMRCAFTAETLLGVLEHVHSKLNKYGIVTPDSIFIGRSGKAKLLLLGCIPGFYDAFANDRRNIYRPYISPEERGGCYPDGRSDIYSVGVFLYEAITGEIPLFSSSGKLIVPDHLRAMLPEGILQIIVRATEKNPSMRYPTADKMCVELRTLQFDSSHIFDHSGNGADRVKTADKLITEQKARIEELEARLAEANAKIKCYENKIIDLREMYDNERRAHELTKEKYANVMLTMDEDRRKNQKKNTPAPPKKRKLLTFYPLDDTELFP